MPSGLKRVNKEEDGGQQVVIVSLLRLQASDHQLWPGRFVYRLAAHN